MATPTLIPTPIEKLRDKLTVINLASSVLIARTPSRQKRRAIDLMRSAVIEAAELLNAIERQSPAQD